MSYEFLAGYTIPALQQPPPLPLALLRLCDEQTETTPTTVSQYQNNERYIPPGLHGTNVRPPAPRPLKRKYNNGRATAKSTPVAETTANGQMVIFQGRDTSYPDELNLLIHPLYCELCSTKMNSAHSAKDHYESKAHDRNITAWLTKKYTEKGLEPPAVKRFLKEGPSGPNAFHCELCDLKLTSLTHANQHYSGRKHRLVSSKVSEPSGAGYYNAEGKWVRTGSKFVPPTTDTRFGIGELFKKDPAAATETQAADTTTTTEGESEPTTGTPTTTGAIEAAAVTASVPLDLSLYCQVCKVSVTSQSQMAMHLQGSKHQKKLKQLGLEASPLASAAEEQAATAVSTGVVSILESINEKANPKADLSMYRTPSGSYYCKTCNMSMCHVVALQQHLIGKKHLKKSSEAKEKAKVAAVTTKEAAKK